VESAEEILRKKIIAALEEDLGFAGDITSQAVVPADLQGGASIVAKEDGVIAGLFVANAVFKAVDSEIEFTQKVEDGAEVKEGQTIAQVVGTVRSILAGERVALNFLGHLSGIATLTKKFVDKARPFQVTIKDTRKTTPEMRILEKYAVRVGGGKSHRFGLYDAVLIKDNHIKAAGGIQPAIESARKNLRPGTEIEVEVEDVADVTEALRGKADIIMLDNMDVASIKEAVKSIRAKALVEVSGGVTLDNVEEIARTGINFISVGAITQSVKALDLSLNLE
jgi:nicotinate-nucleotide pyrophosphorylase (carboxylating)